MQGGDDNQPKTKAGADESVVWQASEYIHHEKSAGWFVVLALGTIVFGTILYLLIKDIFSVIVLALMAITVGVFAGRPPRTLKYRLDHGNLSVGDKQYPLDEFRSFSFGQDGAILSVTFLPVKRFMVPVTVYFSPEDEERILKVLDANLPHEERPPDVIDRWTSKLRF